MSYKQYINLKYRPRKTDLICDFKINPATKNVAGAVASESSTGTWVELTTIEEKKQIKLGAKVFRMKGKNIKIAYPSRLFERNNMPQIFSSIAGNIFNMKEVKSLRLENVEWGEMPGSFRGPKFGVAGIRKITKVSRRPLIGTIIKPKLGLNCEKHAKIAYKSWKGGLDIVKDDENLSNQTFNRFNKRIEKTLTLRKKAEKETGEVKIYMPNVTAETNEMVKRAKLVKRKGGRYIMVDILTVGWSGLQTLREAELGLVIHGHRAMHGALTRNSNHGISMKVLADASRLVGVDQLHIGTAIGKMDESEKEVIEIKNRIQDKLGKLRSVFAVCSGGLHPGHVPKLMNMLGNDIIIQAGGGVHGHPYGTEAGARAMRQAVYSVMKNQNFRKYAKMHKELNVALKYFK